MVPLAKITATTSGLLSPLHETDDWDKRAALTQDMVEHGWRGAPLVTDGENALTGAHRIGAVADAWNEHGVQIDIPFLDVRDLCRVHGVDWEELLDGHDGDVYDAACSLRDLLPPDVVDHLGFDVGGW